MEWKPAHMATLWGINEARTSIVGVLKDYGADLDACSPLNGYGPIHLAAMSGKVDVVRFLLANGVNVNNRSNRWQPLNGIKLEDRSPIGGYDWTPLMVAAGEGHRAVVDLLIDSGADLSPLVAHGANVTFKDNESRQPVDMALSKGFIESAQLLNSTR